MPVSFSGMVGWSKQQSLLLVHYCSFCLFLAILEPQKTVIIRYIMLTFYDSLHIFLYLTVFFSGSNNTDGGILLDKFRHLCFMIYIAFGLLKYNINVIQFTSSQCHGTEHYEDEYMNNEEGIQLLQNRLDQEVQSCTMQDIYKPDITILESNKDQTFSILGRASMIDWLSTVESDSSTGGACSSSALEILKRREKIRYVFQHYPVSYILSSHYVNIVS